MGFFAMVGSMILGIICIILGISRRKKNRWFQLLIAIGLLLVSFAIYLGFPK